MNPVFPDPLAPVELSPTPTDALNAPFLEQQATQERELAQWQEEATTTLDGHLLDFEAYQPDFPEDARRRALVESYLDIRTGPATNDVSHEIRRAHVADALFAGRGAESDDDFFAAIQAEAQGRKDAGTLAEDMLAEAINAELTKNATALTERAPFDAWIQRAKELPGYDSTKAADYLAQWNAARIEYGTRIAPFREELDATFQAIQNGATNVFSTYDALAPEDREDFKVALGLLARQIPNEQRPGFWRNLAKQAGRDFENLSLDTARALDELPDDVRRNTLTPSNARTAEEYIAQELARDENAAAERAKRDFIFDVRQIAEGVVDPIQTLAEPGSTLEAIEKGAYAAPGALYTTGIALTPFLGQVATYGILKEDSYQSLRQSFTDAGLDAATASAAADEWSTYAAIPQTLLERLGARAVVGKVPGVNTALNKLSARLTNRLAAYTARVAAVGAFETAIENTQDLIPYVLQDTAAALEEELPGTDWRQVFDGYGHQTLSTFVAVLPLAIVGAHSGISAETKRATIAQASDLELRAAGVSPEAVEAIRQAETPLERDDAIARALENMDPTSESAIDATQELAEEHQRRKEAVDRARAAGIMPRFVRSPEGWRVIDPETSEEIGTAKDAEGALRLASERTQAIDLDDADRVTYLATLLEAADVVASENTEQRQTTTDLRPGERLTVAQAAAEDPDSEARVLRQLAAREALEGTGTDFAQLVLGRSRTDFAGNVRRTVNRIQSGASVLTVFHEDFHGHWREAQATGRLTREDAVNFLRALDNAIAKNPRNKGLRFLPENDADITDTALDEAIAELGEAEILRTRKGGGTRNVPAGIVTRNLSAILRAAPEAGRKFSAFLRAVRTYFKQVFGRAMQIKRGLADGSIDPEGYDAFFTTLLGIEEAVDFDQLAREAEAAILDGATDPSDDIQLTDEQPFSLGRSDLPSFTKHTFHESHLDPGSRSRPQSERESVAAEELARLVAGGEGPLGQGSIGHGEESVVFALPSGRVLKVIRPRGVDRHTPDGYTSDTSFEAVAEKVALINRLGGLPSSVVSDGTRHFIIQDWGDPVTAEEIEGLELPFGIRPAKGGAWTIELDGYRYRLTDFHPENFRRDSDGAIRLSDVVVGRIGTATENLPDVGDDTALSIGSSPLDNGGESLALEPKYELRTPIRGRTGAEIVGYRWMSRTEEGMFRDRRVSDWERSQTSEPTGRSIVHVYWVRTPDGELKVMGIGAARNALGFTDSKLVSVAKAEQARQRTERQAWDSREASILKNAKQTEAESFASWDSFNNADRAMWGTYAERVAQFAEARRQLVTLTKDGKFHVTRDRQEIDEFTARGWDFAHESQAPSQPKPAPNPATFDPNGQGEFSFSLAPSQVADNLRLDAIDRIRDPQRRARFWQNVARQMDKLRLEAERLELFRGSKRLRASLQREAKIREALRREELENQAMARHLGILSNDELTRLSSQPVHAWFARTKPDGTPDPLHGRIESKGAAEKRLGPMFAGSVAALYDDADGVSPTVFGGTLTVDQAAQEAHNEGLIREATPQALWNALAREAATVRSMQEALKRAKEDIADAKRQAKAETNAWLAQRTQAEDQTGRANERHDILRSLATLDAILGTLPAEVRGNVGGYAQIARLTTEEARLNFLKERIARADTALDTYLRDQFDREFRDLLRQATPDRAEPGEKPRGKAGATVHDLFRAVESAMGMSGTEVEAEAQRLETLAADPDTEPDLVAHYIQTAHMIRLAGDWLKADAGRREAAVTEGLRIYLEGYGLAKIEAARQREERAHARAQAVTDTGKNGTPLELDKRLRSDATLKGKARQLRFGLYSWHQVLQAVFGHDSATANRFADWERAAADAKSDSLQNKLDLIDDLLANLAGGKFKGEQLRHKLANTVLTANTAFGARQLSELEAITATLLWQQADGRRHMEGPMDEAGRPAGPWHYGQDFIDQLEQQLSPEALALRHHLRQQYAAEYDRLNEVYRDLYGINLPRVANYAPITVTPAAGANPATIDPVTGQTITGAAGLTPGSLRTRSTTAVAEPDFRDALQTYIGHTMQMEHWMAYAPLVTEAMAVVNTKEVGKPVTEKAGKEALQTLRDWVAYFTQGGNIDAAAHIGVNQRLSNATNRLAGAALIGRVSVLAIQATQLGAAVAKMPVASYTKRLAKLLTGRLEWGKALKSEYIQRRLREMPPAVQQAMKGLSSRKPSRLKSLVRAIGQSIPGADALFTAGTYAIVYDYHYTHAPASLTAPQERAAYARQMTERAVDDIAQPVRPGTRSLLENNSSSAAMRLLWAFASEGRQKLALSIYAIGEKRSKAEIGRAVAVTWLVGGAVASIIRAAMRDIRSDDDDELFDSRNWDPVRIGIQSLAGPFNGVPILGEQIDRFLTSATGDRPFGEGTLLSALGDPGRTIDDLLDGDIDTVDETLRALETATTAGGAVSEHSAAVTSLLHIIRDLYGIAENIEGTD